MMAVILVVTVISWALLLWLTLVMQPFGNVIYRETMRLINLAHQLSKNDVLGLTDDDDLDACEERARQRFALLDGLDRGWRDWVWPFGFKELAASVERDIRAVGSETTND